MQVEDNFNRAQDFIRKAAEAGARLAILPEYFLTSWVPNDPGFADAHVDREYLSKFCVCNACNFLFSCSGAKVS